MNECPKCHSSDAPTVVSGMGLRATCRVCGFVGGSHEFDCEGGLSESAVKLLGFDEMCQCGHDYGLHAGSPGTECVVLDCKCGHFRAYCKPDQSCCDFCCGN